MGLAERRIAHEFEANHLPEIKKSVESAAGFAVPIEIQWDQLSPAGESRLFIECWTKVYFEPLVQGLSSVGRDAMGKEALAAGLKKIVIQNTASISNSENWAKFESGTLTLDHDPLTNADDIAPRAASLVNTLEAGL